MTLTAPEVPEHEAAAVTPVSVVPDARLVLVDPTLPASTARHLLSALGSDSAGVGVRCADRSKMLSAVRPGVVVVLADPHPAVVGMLTRWGADVVALLLEDAPAVPWLVDVVEEGAAVALVHPDAATLADAVVGLLAA